MHAPAIVAHPLHFGRGSVFAHVQHVSAAAARLFQRPTRHSPTISLPKHREDVVVSDDHDVDRTVRRFSSLKSHFQPMDAEGRAAAEITSEQLKHTALV